MTDSGCRCLHLQLPEVDEAADPDMKIRHRMHAMWRVEGWPASPWAPIRPRTLPNPRDLCRISQQAGYLSVGMGLKGQKAKKTLAIHEVRQCGPTNHSEGGGKFDRSTS